MHREILLHLRKKKFRLLTLWKQRLEEAFPLDEYEGQRPPPVLLFRSFEECIRILRNHPDGDPDWAAKDPSAETPGETFVADEKMLLQVFLVGEQVISDYLIEEKSLRRRVPPSEFLAFLHLLYHTWHNLLLCSLISQARSTFSTVR